MERKRVYYRRRYVHLCPAHGNREEQINQDICPACGQRGEFRGFFQGIYDRMSRRSQSYGFPCTGVHMTFLPKLVRRCERCDWEGIVRGDDFDYECPDCDGTGGFVIRTEEEMRKIRRWALARKQREIEERHASVETDKPRPTRVPDNPIHTRDGNAFVKGMMAIHNYNMKYGERNDLIGELVLPCDDHGWDVFMEMIEIWDNSGRGLGVSQDAILLKASPRKNAVTLLSLVPPSGDLPQRLLVNRRKIRQIFGRQTELEFWKRFEDFSLANEGWVPVDERITREDVGSWIDLLARTE